MCRKPLTAVKGFRQKGGVKRWLVGGKGLEPLTPTLKVSYSTYWVNHPFIWNEGWELNSRSLIGFAVCVCLTTWLPSCIYFWLCNRHNPTLLQPRGSGSHLYTANRYTLRWDVFGGEVLLALVGFPFFRVASPHLCVFIIAHLVRFVKGFLKNFSKIFLRGVGGTISTNRAPWLSLL